MLVATSNGRLAAIDLESGLLAWQSEQGDGLLRSLALAPQVVVGVRGGAEPGLVGYAHDPAGTLVSLVSPTEVDLPKLLLASSPRRFLWPCSRSWRGAGCAPGWVPPSWTMKTTLRSSPAKVSGGPTDDEQAQEKDPVRPSAKRVPQSQARGARTEAGDPRFGVRSAGSGVDLDAARANGAHPRGRDGTGFSGVGDRADPLRVRRLVGADRRGVPGSVRAAREPAGAPADRDQPRRDARNQTSSASREGCSASSSSWSLGP